MQQQNHFILLNYYLWTEPSKTESWTVDALGAVTSIEHCFNTTVSQKTHF